MGTWQLGGMLRELPLVTCEVSRSLLDGCELRKAARCRVFKLERQPHVFDVRTGEVTRSLLDVVSKGTSHVN